MTDLQNAVHALTEPVHETTAIKDADGKWVRVHTVEHPPLLTQLEQAVKPASAVSGPGTPSMPSERSPIDLGALLEFAKISSEIRSWCHRRHVPVTRPPSVDVVQDLRAWYDASEGLDGGWYVRQLGRWATLIEGLLRPGESFEADYPCPICGGSGWGEFIGGGSTRAILVSYRLDGGGRMVDERAVCRLCRAVWVGHESVMELAEEQHTKENN